MEKNLNKLWDDTVEWLCAMPSERRTHFANLVIRLAQCYKENNTVKAVVLINDADSLMTFSAGATEYECAEILQIANEIVSGVVTADAPAKEMFN
jgi:hypothetical protein